MLINPYQLLPEPTCLKTGDSYLSTEKDLKAVKEVRDRVISGLYTHYLKKNMDAETLPIRISEVCQKYRESKGNR